MFSSLLGHVQIKTTSIVGFCETSELAGISANFGQRFKFCSGSLTHWKLLLK